jgi:hypothetical protein
VPSAPPTETVAPPFAAIPPAPEAGLPATPPVEFAGPAAVAPIAAPQPPAAKRSISRRTVAIGTVLVGLGVVAAGAFFVLGASNPQQLPVDLVARIAARDASAAKLLASDKDLATVASGMGLVGLPGSVTVTVENAKVVDETPSSAPSVSGSGDRTFKVTYTLKLGSSKGVAGKADQTLTAVVTKDKDGVTHLANVTVTSPIVFDAAGYFGSTGTSIDEANKVAADMRAGTAWIPGLTVTVTPVLSDVSLPDVETPVPGHLTTWRQTVSPGVVGSRTTWAVQVLGGTDTLMTLSPASKITVQAVAAQVNVGSLDNAAAIEAARQIEAQFWEAVNAGDVAHANYLLTADGPRLTASGLTAMKGGAVGSDTTSATTKEGENGPEVQLDLMWFVLGPDGTWALDGPRSNLTIATLPGNGHAEHIVATVKNTGSGAITCKMNITIKLERVEFLTSGTNFGVFSFATSGGKCDMDDSILAATTGWKGQSGIKTTFGVEGTDTSDTDTSTSSVLRWLVLPDSATPTVHPIWITITRYGTEGGAILPYAMKFQTR